MADLHGVVEVFHELCVPHFYHATRNSLIINELHILHRKVASRFPSISINHKKSIMEYEDVQDACVAAKEDGFAEGKAEGKAEGRTIKVNTTKLSQPCCDWNIKK